MENEVGDLSEAHTDPKIKGTLAQKRAAERKQKELEHKERVAKLKNAKVTPIIKESASRKKPGFDKSLVNSYFFANAK